MKVSFYLDTTATDNQTMDQVSAAFAELDRPSFDDERRYRHHVRVEGIEFFRDEEGTYFTSKQISWQPHAVQRFELPVRRVVVYEGFGEYWTGKRHQPALAIPFGIYEDGSASATVDRYGDSDSRDTTRITATALTFEDAVRIFNAVRSGNISEPKIRWIDTPAKENPEPEPVVSDPL